LTILFSLIVLNSAAQSKKQREALSGASGLEMAIFEEKDSLILDKMFSRAISFTWADGRTESKQEAIRSIMSNRSVFSEESRPTPYDIIESGDSMLVKHVYTAKETKPDNTEVKLKFSIESVWAKEEGKWKLFRCRITDIK
jgi:ketosteroid isomerase-like protein